jgi:hypothetical protein
MILKVIFLKLITIKINIINYIESNKYINIIPINSAIRFTK